VKEKKRQGKPEVNRQDSIGFLEKDWKVWFEREKRSNINNALLYETFALDFLLFYFY